MNSDNNLERRHHINRIVRDSIYRKLTECSEFLYKNFNTKEINNYKYSPDEAIEELGLERYLIEQLVEDYVIQIIKTKALFIEHLEVLKEDKENLKKLDYTPLRELAHKNLGVARNLRIEDGKKILTELMKVDDLDYLALCIEGLEFCAIRLKPKCAHETLELIDIKNSFYLKD